MTKSKFHSEDPQILGTNAQNLVTMMTWHQDLYTPSIYVHVTCRAVYSVGLWPLNCWDCGFKSHCRHECLSLVSVVRQRSLFWVNHSSRVLPSVVCSKRVIAKPRKGTPWPQNGFKAPQEKKCNICTPRSCFKPYLCSCKSGRKSKKCDIPIRLK
jgi:hypothetical protein